MYPSRLDFIFIIFHQGLHCKTFFTLIFVPVFYWAFIMPAQVLTGYWISGNAYAYSFFPPLGTNPVVPKGSGESSVFQRDWAKREIKSGNVDDVPFYFFLSLRRPRLNMMKRV